MTQPLRRQPLVDQTANHLRECFASGRWKGDLPGVLQLSRELLVSKHIVRAALLRLEKEGCIRDRGPGRPREIVSSGTPQGAIRPLRVAILLCEPLDREESHSVHVLLGIRQAVESSGHLCLFADETLATMGRRIPRIASLVAKTAADAWILYSSPEEVLEWFASQPLPVMALGGRFHNLSVASSANSMVPALRSAMDALGALGHRRIVLMVPAILRQPTPGPSVEKFLSILRGMGVTPTRYHLPDFEESAEGFENCLTELFRVTPPTALVILEPCYCAAALAFLARRGLQVPNDVSIVCMLSDPVFRFILPSLAHFRWPVEGHIQRIARWVSGVATGHADRRQVILDAEFVPGQTLAPAKKHGAG